MMYDFFHLSALVPPSVTPFQRRVVKVLVLFQHKTQSSDDNVYEDDEGSSSDRNFTTEYLEQGNQRPKTTPTAAMLTGANQINIMCVL